MTERHDYPRPIVCTCGHAFGHHDDGDPCYRCTRCSCRVYFTNWSKARKLGWMSTGKARRCTTARTRWMAHRK